MIKGTTSDCLIKDIKVSKSKAYITLIILSREMNTPAIPLNIYIKDYELDVFKSARELGLINDLLDTSGTYYKTSSEAETKETTTIVSKTTYWLDKLDSYSNDNFNVNINMYKEIPIEIDITNQNKASIVNNRFVRQIRIELMNTKTDKLVWASENILLISKQISLPEITNIHLETSKDYKISGQFTYNYTDDEDFSYNNQHLFTTIVVKSPQTNKVLETVTIEDEDYYHSTVKFSLNNTYTSTITINIILKSYYGSETVIDKWTSATEYTERMVGGTAMKSKQYVYTPEIKYSNAYVKVNGIVKRIAGIYRKEKEVS